MEINVSSLIKVLDPKTFVAGVTPVCVGALYSIYHYDDLHIGSFLLLLLGVLLLQGAANMLNDYFDYKRGADSFERANEKILVSGELSSENLLKIVVTFVILGIIIGLYFAIKLHWMISVITILGVFVLYRYSYGNPPISYTPFGELIVSLTMGTGIITTVIYILTGEVSYRATLVALPTALYIASVLLTNNISDWIEDKANGRRTLPIVVGIYKSEKLWEFLCIGMIILQIIYTSLKIWPVITLLFVLVLFPYKTLLGFKEIEKHRVNKSKLMANITRVGISYHLALVLGIIVSNFI